MHFPIEYLFGRAEDPLKLKIIFIYEKVMQVPFISKSKILGPFISSCHYAHIRALKAKN